MEIKEAIKNREILEADIRKYVDNRLIEFKKETSLTPSNIYITLSSIHIIGDPLPVCTFVESVEVKIQL